MVDYELIRPDDGDEITFLKNVLGVLTVGKTRTISKFYTEQDSTDAWSVSDPFSYIGCVAPYSAVNATTGVIYLSRDGIYSFGGQVSSKISDVVTDKIRDILATNIEEVVGVFHDNRYLMAYTSEETGEANNNRVLVLDLQRDAYYQDIKSIDSFAAFDSGDDYGTLFSGSSESDGNIYAHKLDFNKVIYRYKSELQEGTYDSVYIGGTEEEPYISLGSGETWAESTDAWEDSGSKTWLVDAQEGYWYSPTVQIDATALDKLYWNESLGVTGDVGMYVRQAATAGSITAASWSSEYSDPSGSDLSGLTANNYIQFKAKLTTSLWTETPQLYSANSSVLRMTYLKEGTSGESSILALYDTGKLSLDAGDYPKRIKEIHVYYTGTSGTLNVEVDNDQGDAYDFDVDLSVDPSDASDDQYFGTSTERVYVYMPSFRDNPIGRFWTIKLSEEGTESWQVDRIVVRYDVNDYVTFK